MYHYCSGRFNTVSVTNVTLELLRQLQQLTFEYAYNFKSMPGLLYVGFTLEPFLPSCFNKSQGGAYPHVPSANPLFPILIQFGWLFPSTDDFFINEIQSAANRILQSVLNEDQDVDSVKQIRYPNYALENTLLLEMYGDNVGRLQKIRQAWDPDNVTYLAGGFKF